MYSLNHPHGLLDHSPRIEGNYHAGITVQHLYRVKANPNQLNLHRVHFINLKLLKEVARANHKVKPDDLGGNIAVSGTAREGNEVTLQPKTEGVDVKEGDGHQVIETTEPRNPCHQTERSTMENPDGEDYQAGGRYYGDRGAGMVESDMGEEPLDGKVPPGSFLVVFWQPGPKAIANNRNIMALSSKSHEL